MPPDDERSNYLLVKKTLLERIDGSPEVHRMKGELGGAAAAAEYDAELEGVHLGLALQGIGPDGHTASLFPNAPALEERERRVVAAPHEDVERVTMTLPMLSAARQGPVPRSRRVEGGGRAEGLRGGAEPRDAGEPAPLEGRRDDRASGSRGCRRA